MVPEPVTTSIDKTVAVIGGGVSGVLSAWELARAGARVILIEARALGNGASSRSAACVRAQFETPATVKGMLYSIRFFEQWTGIIPNSQAPLRQSGYLFLKNYQADVDAVRRTVAMQHEAGLAAVEWLNPTALGERFSYLDTTGLVGATWCPTDGFIQPAIIYQDGAEAARTLGATIIQNDPVVSAEVAGKTAVAARLASGRRVEADLFVNAANVWAPEVSRMFGGAELPVVAEKRYLYFLSGLKGESDWGLSLEEFAGMPLTVTPAGAYCRPENKQLMIGWLHRARPVAPTFDNQDEIEPGFGLGTSFYGAAVRKEITQFLPAAQDMGRIEAVTTGYYDTTPDRNPIIDFDPRLSNLVHACGFSGHGVMHAPFTGRIVAELAVRGERRETIDLPGGFGPVSLAQYALDRAYVTCEGMVI